MAKLIERHQLELKAKDAAEGLQGSLGGARSRGAYCGRYRHCRSLP